MRRAVLPLPNTHSWRGAQLKMKNRDNYLYLFTHVALGLPSGLFPSSFLTDILYESLLSPMRAAVLVHFILLDLFTLIILLFDILKYMMMIIINSLQFSGTDTFL
jgi:hypothetical protein